jgi:hypothetical protein
VNLKDVIVAAFFVAAYAHSGEEVLDLTLTTGLLVKYEQVRPEYFKIHDWTWLKDEERAEVFLLLSDGCIMRREAEPPPSMYVFMLTDRVFKRDCGMEQKLDLPVGLLNNQGDSDVVNSH